MSDNQTALVRDFSTPLVASKGWMKFLGIMYIITGVLGALSIIGIIVAWIPIWLGVLLIQASNAIDRSGAGGDAASFRHGLSKIKLYFIVNGVLMLIVVAFYVIAFFGVMSMGMF